MALDPAAAPVRQTAPAPRHPVPLAPRWAGVLLAGCALVLVPWIVLLGASLPSQHRASHWDAAWVGFDLGLLAAFTLTALLVWRRSSWLPLAATVTATLLVCDAWFDVLLSGAGRERVVALVSAVLVELPLAGFCLWLAGHAELVVERTAWLRRWCGR